MPGVDRYCGGGGSQVGVERTEGKAMGLRVHFVLKADRMHCWMSGVRRQGEPMVTLQVLASNWLH